MSLTQKSQISVVIYKSNFQFYFHANQFGPNTVHQAKAVIGFTDYQVNFID